MKLRTRIVLSLATLAILLLTVSAGHAATRTVPSAAYPSVQDAVDAAGPGDTILIKPGTYKEEVHVSTEGLMLFGNCSNPRSVILDGTESGYGIRVYADDIQVRCLTLRHYDGGIYVDDHAGLSVYRTHFRNCDTGIYGDGDDFSVVASVFFGCEDHSMDFDGETGTVSYCTSNNSGGYELEGDGLVFRDNSVEQAEDEECIEYDGDGGRIERLLCDGSDYYAGIDVDGDDNVVRENTVRNAYYDGLLVDGDDNTVERNVVTNTDDYGIDVSGDRNTIRWNKVSSTDSECFYIDGDELLIEGNEASNCVDDGFEIDGNKLTIKDNSVDGVADGYGFDIDCSGPTYQGSYHCHSYYYCHYHYYYEPCAWATITGNTSQSTGEDYAAFDISGENLTIRNNRAENAYENGFYMSVDDSTIESNRAFWTGSEHEDAFRIYGDDNTIRYNTGQFNAGSACLSIYGDDNLIKSNSCRDNLADGILVDSGSRNRVEFNVVQRNEGEGIQNDGSDTELYRNTSISNRIDCAGDDGTEALDSSNNCADGSDFDTADEIDP